MNLRLLLFVLVLRQISCELPIVNDTIETSTTTTTATKISKVTKTHLQPLIERVFIRKKRFLLLPKGANLKFTCQISKRLLAKIPRGFNFNIEVALYYPTPTSRIDLLPKRLRKPTTTTPKPKGTKEPIFVYIPGSLVRYKAKPANKPQKVQRIDADKVQWIDNQYKYKNYTHAYNNLYNNDNKWLNFANNKKNWSKYANWSDNLKQKWQPAVQKWQPNAEKWHKYVDKKWSNMPYQTINYHNKWSRSYHKQPPMDDPHLAEYEPMDLPELEPYEDWPHYHSHRDRRQLFHGFEGFSKILGIDMKSCILRAICETKTLLLPRGYSMLHDILRVVFTFPTISGLNDDYSQIMRSDPVSCVKQLQSQCSFSLLLWLLHPEKAG